MRQKERLTITAPITYPAQLHLSSCSAWRGHGSASSCGEQLTGARRVCLVCCRDILCFEGFRSPWYKQLLFAVLGVCTGGLLFLVAKWSLTVRIVLRLQRCSLKQAQYVRTTVSATWVLAASWVDNQLCLATRSMQQAWRHCEGPPTNLTWPGLRCVHC